MDLSRMLASEAASSGAAVAASGPTPGASDEATAVGEGSGDVQAPPSKRARREILGDGTEPDESVIAAAAQAAAGVAEDAASPYTELQRSVHKALETKDGQALTTSDKVALALEVLRARQLELDLAQARSNIEALVTKTGSAPRTLRSVIPASTVKGLPVGTPVEISAAKFLLSPTTNDPQALFLTLELQHFGHPTLVRPSATGNENSKEDGKTQGDAETPRATTAAVGPSGDGLACEPSGPVRGPTRESAPGTAQSNVVSVSGNGAHPDSVRHGASMPNIPGASANASASASANH